MENFDRKKSKLRYPHHIFFLAAIFFGSGVVLESLGVNFSWIILGAAAAGLLGLFLLKPSFLALLTILVPAGAFYCYFFDIYLTPLAAQLSALLTTGFWHWPAEWLRTAYQRLFAVDEAGLLIGITLGGGRGLDFWLLNKLSLSGLRHLTALSGLHFSIVVLTATGLLKRFLPARKKLAAAVLAVFSLLFAGLTGWRVSALRAAFMVNAVSLAEYKERFYYPLNSLMAAGWLLLLLNPNQLLSSASFQLSFLAVAGVVWLSPLIKQFLRIKNKGFLNWKENGVITIAAQLAVAPLLIYYFSDFNLTSIVSNILVLPVVPLTMGLGYLAGILYYLWRPLALMIGWLTAGLLRYQLAVISVFSTVRLSLKAAVNWQILAAYYLILAAAVWKFRK